MRKKIWVWGGVVVLALLPATAGLAQEGYVHIGPYHFDTVGTTNPINIMGGSLALESFAYRTQTAGYIHAAFEFPPEADGLLVRQITISYKDNDASNNIVFRLRKVDLYDQSVTTVATISSSGSSSSWRRMSINRWDMAARRINNQRYAWYIAVDFQDV